MQPINKKVIIVGGSVAGLTLALALEHTDIDFVVIERGDYAPPVCFLISFLFFSFSYSLFFSFFYMFSFHFFLYIFFLPTSSFSIFSFSYNWYSWVHHLFWQAVVWEYWINWEWSKRLNRYVHYKNSSHSKLLNTLLGGRDIHMAALLPWGWKTHFESKCRKDDVRNVRPIVIILLLLD